MPSRFLDGKTTTKFDHHVVPSMLRDINNIAVKVDLTYTTDQTDKMFAKRDKRIDELEEVCNDIGVATAKLSDNICYILDYKQAIDAFLSSPLIRFLNFFGQWFIYGNNGYVYRNVPSNEIYGQAPFLTRVKRRLIIRYNRNKK